MANRYWVGGTDTWDGTAGLKWSATSGGAGGASVPTAADDVFFDASSTGTCTINNTTTAKSINCTGFTGTISLSSDVYVYGDFILSAAMGYNNGGRIIYINGTATLTSAGKNFSGVTIDGGVVSLGDALSIGNDYRNLTINAGTFNTNNYNVTAFTFTSNTTNSRTINLGSSTISLRIDSGFFITINSTNLTFNAGTSTFTNTSNNWGTADITAPNVTFYALTMTWGETRNFSGSMTFTNLTISNVVSNQYTSNSFNGNITVTGTLNTSSANAYQRNFLFSNSLGTQRTFTVNTLSATNTDFRDINLAGAASPATVTRGGDCGGNSGITFPAPKTVYRVSSGGAFVTNNWSFSSGGAVDANAFPLAQDTVIINNSSPNTLQFGRVNIGTFDASARTNALTLSGANGTSPAIHGDFIYGSGITCTLTGSGTVVSFLGRNITSTVTTLNKSTFNISINMVNGTCSLGSAFAPSATTGASVQFTQGTFTTNNYTITSSAGGFQSAMNSGGSGSRTVNAGTSLWLLNSRDNNNRIWNVSGSNFTWNATNAVLRYTVGINCAFLGGGNNYQNTAIDLGISTILTITNNNTFKSITNTYVGTGAAHVRFTSNSTNTFANWLATGASGRTLTVDASTAGTRANIVLTNAISIVDSINYLAVKDINVTQANKFYAGAASTNNGNNINVIFTDPPAPASPSGQMLMLFM